MLDDTSEKEQAKSPYQEVELILRKHMTKNLKKVSDYLKKQEKLGEIWRDKGTAVES